MSKPCLKQPVPEIFLAFELLNEAVTMHLEGNYKRAEELIIQADMDAIREWTESIWGKGGIYSQLKLTLGKPSTLNTENRDDIRMPNKKGKNELLKRDGHQCRFCGIPVIRKEVRVLLNKLYPKALLWKTKNIEQHAAFQAMWVQYDHLIPHARGGRTSLDNMVITCAPCNYGRMNYLLEEIDLKLPEIVENRNPNWDGLERILKSN